MRVGECISVALLLKPWLVWEWFACGDRCVGNSNAFGCVFCQKDNTISSIVVFGALRVVAARRMALAAGTRLFTTCARSAEQHSALLNYVTSGRAHSLSTQSGDSIDSILSVFVWFFDHAMPHSLISLTKAYAGSSAVLFVGLGMSELTNMPPKVS